MEHQRRLHVVLGNVFLLAAVRRARSHTRVRLATLPGSAIDGQADVICEMLCMIRRKV